MCLKHCVRIMHPSLFNVMNYASVVQSFDESFRFVTDLGVKGALPLKTVFTLRIL